VLGIINGTTNFILTKMTDAVAGGGEADYATALAEAQRLGFAERDPTADVEGFDAGAKAAIIATVAFGAKVVAGDVYHEGISRITGAEIAIAHRLGYVVKLLGIVERDADDGESACGSTRRWCRSTIRWRRCATASTRCSSKATSSTR
jgi:homoserine dehydrogenase